MGKNTLMDTSDHSWLMVQGDGGGGDGGGGDGGGDGGGESGGDAGAGGEADSGGVSGEAGASSDAGAGSGAAGGTGSEGGTGGAESGTGGAGGAEGGGEAGGGGPSGGAGESGSGGTASAGSAAGGSTSGGGGGASAGGGGGGESAGTSSAGVSDSSAPGSGGASFGGFGGFGGAEAAQADVDDPGPATPSDQGPNLGVFNDPGPITGGVPGFSPDFTSTFSSLGPVETVSAPPASQTFTGPQAAPGQGKDSADPVSAPPASQTFTGNQTAQGELSGVPGTPEGSALSSGQIGGLFGDPSAPTGPGQGPGFFAGGSTPDATSVSTVSVTPSAIETVSAPPASQTFTGNLGAQGELSGVPGVPEGSPLTSGQIGSLFGDQVGAPPTGQPSNPDTGFQTGPGLGIGTPTGPSSIVGGPSTDSLQTGLAQIGSGANFGPGGVLSDTPGIGTAPSDPGSPASVFSGGGDVLAHGGGLGGILSPGAAPAIFAPSGGVAEVTGDVVAPGTPELDPTQLSLAPGTATMSPDQIVAFTQAQTNLLGQWSQVISPDDARWPKVVQMVNQQALQQVTGTGFNVAA